jgi:hypothetical protein
MPIRAIIVMAISIFDLFNKLTPAIGKLKALAKPFYALLQSYSLSPAPQE